MYRLIRQGDIDVWIFEPFPTDGLDEILSSAGSPPQGALEMPLGPDVWQPDQPVLEMPLGSEPWQPGDPLVEMPFAHDPLWGHS